MSGIMGKEINTGESGREPSRKKIDCQRKAVHLREQSDNKGRKGSKRSPFAGSFRFRKTKREYYEYQ